MEEITWYTGLSPTAFFTIAFMMIVVYRTVSAMFVSPEDYNKPPVVSARTDPRFVDPEPPREPVQLGEITDQELRSYNGSDPSKPLLMAIKGQIYDVSAGRYRFRFFFCLLCQIMKENCVFFSVSLMDNLVIL
jgi:membrane-associated progesterone receptor component